MPHRDQNDAADTTCGGQISARDRRRLEFSAADIVSPVRDYASEELEITLDGVVPLPDETYIQYVTVRGQDPVSIIGAFESLPTTFDARLLWTDRATHGIESHESSESLFAVFHEFGGRAVSARYDKEGLTMVVDVPPETTVSDVVESVDRKYPQFKLVSSSEIVIEPTTIDDITAVLTDRQLTALRIAYLGGYFRRPRASDGRDLADRMGISRQAFHKHLRNAHSSVYGELL